MDAKELAENVKRLREIPDFEEIKPCPYVNGFLSANQGVTYVVKPYEHYTDIVLFSNGEPDRCLRVGHNNKATDVLVQLVGEMVDLMEHTRLQYGDLTRSFMTAQDIEKYRDFILQKAITKAAPIAELSKQTND